MLRRPQPRRPARKRPVPHTAKKPKMVSTGTRVDRLCGICLGRLLPGVAITFCECGKFFHLDCMGEVRKCPFCNYPVIVKERSDFQPAETPLSEDPEGYGSDMTEEVYQCPICEVYVKPEAETCQCGAVFDREIEERDVFLCPSCGTEVERDALRCDNCGLDFEPDEGEMED